MTTICLGTWPHAPAHPPRFLSHDGVPDGKVSHGLCHDCRAALNAAMDAIEASRRSDFRDVDPVAGAK